MTKAKQLKQFVEDASARVDLIFKVQGHVAPMYHIVSPKGEHVLPAPPLPKDEAVRMMRALLREVEATRVLYIDEAWTLRVTDGKESEYTRGEKSLEGHPDRVEQVIFMAEDRDEGTLLGQREIIRDGNKVTLGPLVISRQEGALSGRMVGLLPTDGSAH